MEVKGKTLFFFLQISFATGMTIKKEVMYFAYLNICPFTFHFVQPVHNGSVSSALKEVKASSSPTFIVAAVLLQ